MIDASGRTKEIQFSRPTTVPVYIKITGLVTDVTFGGADTIKAALIDFIGTSAGDITASGLGIGEDVYFNRLVCPVNEVRGVVDFIIAEGSAVPASVGRSMAKCALPC